ncbi:hypothetical protein [Nodosilinea nodulosa]|uniref:hypothetical protein n=1 Tax=Nodosilinea nodulosa TaxID=416001 RepID=UPI0003809315|nr:hypothetical protein [Nodosilinea nodulosa]
MIKLFQKLPRIDNLYTPWPRPEHMDWVTKYGIYTKPIDHGPVVWQDMKYLGIQLLEFKIIFGLFAIAIFSDYRIGLSAQSWTTFVRLGKVAFAFRSVGQRSCENCKNYVVETTYDYETGPDADIFCKAAWPNMQAEHPQSDMNNEGEFYDAWRCPSYQFFDWKAYFKAQAEQEALAYAIEVEAEKAYQEYLQSEEYQKAAEAQQAKDFKQRGWMDESGELTDAFYYLSDLAADAARERRYR